MDSPDLASLLCSRLCHDLLSPIGAFGNGLELLADESDPKMRENCLDLLAHSASAAAAKLKFYRLAFGAAAGFAEEVDTGDAHAALAGLWAGERKVELGWALGDEPLPKGAVKLLLNLALIAGEALVRGGRLDIGVERSAEGIEMVIRAAGPRLTLAPELRRTLVEGEAAADALGPRTAGAWLAHRLAAAAGAPIRLSDPADELLVIGVALPAAG